MGAGVLLDNRQIRIWVEEHRPIVWMQRTKLDLPRDAEELDLFFCEVVASLEGLDRAELGMLVDARAAIGRNDPEFDRFQERYRAAMFGGFRRVAVVLRTVAGALQVARYGRGDDLIEVALFSEVEPALRHLCLPAAVNADRRRRRAG